MSESEKPSLSWPELGPAALLQERAEKAEARVTVLELADKSIKQDSLKLCGVLLNALDAAPDGQLQMIDIAKAVADRVGKLRVQVISLRDEIRVQKELVETERTHGARQVELRAEDLKRVAELEGLAGIAAGQTIEFRLRYEKAEARVVELEAKLKIHEGGLRSDALKALNDQPELQDELAKLKEEHENLVRETQWSNGEIHLGVEVINVRFRGELHLSQSQPEPHSCRLNLVDVPQDHDQGGG